MRKGWKRAAADLGERVVTIGKPGGKPGNKSVTETE
jgi:hypothetical protein